MCLNAQIFITMKDNTTKALKSLLNAVIEVKDSYTQAAKDVHSTETKNLFQEIAEQKTNDAIELKSILEAESNTVINLKDVSDARTGGMGMLQSLFSDKGEKTIIEHCIIDEKSLAEKYKSVLHEESLNDYTKTILRQQLARSFDHNTSLWERSVKSKGFEL